MSRAHDQHMGRMDRTRAFEAAGRRRLVSITNYVDRAQHRHRRALEPTFDACALQAIELRSAECADGGRLRRAIGVAPSTGTGPKDAAVPVWVAVAHP